MGGKVGLGTRFLRWLGIGGKAAKGADKAAKGGKILTKPLKLGLLGGVTSFFGFEWLTNSGLVRAVGGTLGIDTTAASILIIAVVIAVLVIVLYALYKHMTKGTSTGRGGGGRGSRGGSK